MDIIREMRFRNFHVSYGQLFDLSRFDGDYIPTYRKYTMILILKIQ